MLLRPGGADLSLKPSLAITSLTLSSFRNYDSARIEPTADLVALCGHNGAGKTNLLEAISLLTPGRGPDDAECPAFFNFLNKPVAQIVLIS